ncbi:hypothetical protein cypCar_00040905 [Cyprinus carpio]|nr:hypothetical protein cypCar_00040905 [Cyprinus carpio]
MGLTTGPNGARAAPQKSLRRVWQRGGRGSKVKHRGGTMEGEQSTPASSASSSTGTNTSTTNSTGTTSASTASIVISTSSSSSRTAVPQISVYSGIPDRQTVQVIQQALHRQPSTAAQYLQQMYAAQQQHLMLQTAALQQQHLSTAQLQSLAAVQQINLTTSPAAAQLISRAQNVNSTPSGISQQAVLLGNATSSTLTASQAQMYLRAQMAQQSNLVHVARSLGRAVPLSPQLILAPTATVTALQSDTNTANNTQSASAQVQNLALRNQQGASSTSQSSGLQALSLKQTPVSIQPTPLIKTPSQSASSSDTGKSNANTASVDGVKKGEEGQTEMKAVNMSRNVSSSHPLLAPAYAQIQPQALIKQQPQQFVIQPQAPPTSRTQPQLLQTASVQPHQQTASLTIQSSAQTSSVAGIIPVLPKPALHNQGSAQSQQATIFHSTVSHHALNQHGSHTGLAHAKAQPVQLTAINLQIQPAQSQSSRLAQDDKEKPTSLVVREICPPVQMQPTTTTQGTDPPEQSKADTVNTTSQAQGTVEKFSCLQV